MNPILQTQLFQLGVVVVLVLLWAVYYRTSVRLWLQKGGDSPFPIFGVIVLSAVTLVGFLLISNDLANKKVPPPSGAPAVEVKRVVIEPREPQVQTESLEDKTTRMLDQNRSDNEKAKEAFSKLPPATNK